MAYRTLSKVFVVSFGAINSGRAKKLNNAMRHLRLREPLRVANGEQVNFDGQSYRAFWNKRSAISAAFLVADRALANGRGSDSLIQDIRENYHRWVDPDFTVEL